MRESSKALAAYVTYRDMGEDRSIDKVAKQYQKQPALLHRWSQAHNWVERVKAHDEQIAASAAKRNQQERLKDDEKRKDDRRKIYGASRSVAAASFRHMKPEELAKRPEAVVRMLTYADTGERLDAGEATERSEHSGALHHDHHYDLTGFSDDELRDILTRATRADTNGAPAA